MVTSDGVDAGCGQTSGYVGGVLMLRQICAKREIDAPETDSLGAAIEMAGARNKADRIGIYRLCRGRCNERIRVRPSRDYEGNEALCDRPAVAESGHNQDSKASISTS
jgi:hypothetical protein